LMVYDVLELAISVEDKPIEGYVAMSKLLHHAHGKI
jgi:rubrerythrin